MSLRVLLTLLLSATSLAGLPGCAADTTPTWAADRIVLEPAPSDLLMPVGLQVWTLHGPRWADAPRERFYSCAVLVELSLGACTAGACEPCDACEIAWSITDAVVTDTDCESLPELPELTAVGLGSIADPLRDEPDTASATGGSWARYDQDWVAHGWTDGEPDTPLQPPLTAWPTYAWPL